MKPSQILNKMNVLGIALTNISNALLYIFGHLQAVRQDDQRNAL